ncbi:MAG: hydrogenase formation protein HypD [Candidatus Humimicrobiia bacterium]
MRYIEEFRDSNLAKKIISKLKKVKIKEATYMEVCGTHTVNASKFGIRQALPKNLKLISGPGCPVCVTDNRELDIAIEMLREYEITLATFGDMMRVPSSYSSLEKEKADGKNIRVIYSPIDALNLAKENPEKDFVLFGVGFETTTPMIAHTIKVASKKRIKNFYVYSVHKLIPPALKVLVKDENIKINGFLCPGHVSVIIGSNPYEFIARDYKIPCVITGFEPLDILQGILMLVIQTKEKEAKVEIQYKRGVNKEGNKVALELINDVFDKSDALWRGLGIISQSGLVIKEKYSQFDALKKFPVDPPPVKKHKGCKCGDVLKGLIMPYNCPLFKNVCNPLNPVGPCMVSSEGSCAAYYHYAS